MNDEKTYEIIDLVFKDVESDVPADVVARIIEKQINRNNDEFFDSVIDKLLRTHRTLQQGIMRQLILKFIQQVAESPSEYFDGRNEAMKIMCNKIVENLGDDHYLPFI